MVYRVSFPYPQQKFPSDIFLIMVVLAGVRCYFSVLLICISPVVSDVEQHFVCLVTIYLSIQKRCLMRPFSHFDGVSFGCSVVRAHSTFWTPVPSQVHDFQKVIPLCRLSASLQRAFEVQKLFYLASLSILGGCLCFCCEI